MSEERAGRLALAMPFTVIPDAGCVRLIGGEDLRFTFRAPGLESWLPALIDAFAAGPARPADAIAALDPRHRRAAEGLVARLLAERILAPAPARPAPAPAPYRLEVTGEGALADAIRERAAPRVEGAGGARAAPVLRALAQETLDLGAALAFDRAARREVPAWLWVTSGPAARALVSPVFLPGGGPCAGCLLAAFRRLSPAPELHDALLAHGARGGAFAGVTLPGEALAIVAALAAWKARAIADPDPPAAAFELHVLELASMSVSTHPLALDPDCAGEHAVP